jgi:hypothetical protein
MVESISRGLLGTRFRGYDSVAWGGSTAVVLGTIRNKWLLRVSGDCVGDRRLMLTDGLINERA